MPREPRCSVCRSPHRDEIDRALIGGTPSRRVAAQFGSVSRAAIQRHAASHLPVSLVQAVHVQEIARADTLLDEVRNQVSRADRLFAEAEAVLDGAKANGDVRGVLSAIKVASLAARECRNNLELVGRVAGELRGEGGQVNVVASPEWVALRAAIIEALTPYPEALAAVVRALRSGAAASAPSVRVDAPELPARTEVHHGTR
jgi:hypothetical protein